MSQDPIPSQLRSWLWHSWLAKIENSVIPGAQLPYKLSSASWFQKVWSLTLVINHSQPFLSLSDALIVASNSHRIPLSLNHYFPWTFGCLRCCTLQWSLPLGFQPTLPLLKVLQWYCYLFRDSTYHRWEFISLPSADDPTPKSYFRICFLAPPHLCTNNWRTVSSPLSDSEDLPVGVY